MKAWELLEQKNWCQHAYAKDENGNSCNVEMGAYAICPAAAISLTYGPNNLYREAIDKLAREVHEYVPHWNDVAGRTKQEVIDAMKRADV